MIAIGLALLGWLALDPALEACRQPLADGPGDAAVSCVRGQARLSAASRRDITHALDQLADSDEVNPHVLLSLGTLEVVEGNPAAVARLGDAATAYAAAGDNAGEVHARLALARYFSARGRSSEARVEVEAARAVASTDLLSAMVDLERALQISGDGDGDLAAGRRILDRALATLPDDAPYGLRASALRVGIDLANWMADDRSAQRFSRRQAELFEEHGDEYGRVQAEFYALRHQMMLHDAHYAPLPETFLPQHVTLVAEAKAAGNTYIASVASCVLGDLLPSPSERLEHLRHCVELRRELGYSVNYAQHILARNLGHDFEDGRDEALATLDEALTTATDGFDPWGQAEGLATRAGLHWAWGEHDAALADWERAFAVIEAIRDRQQDATIKAGVFSFFASYYHSAAGALLSQGDTARAFDVLERMRARQLLDALDEAAVTPSIVDHHPAARERAQAQARMAELADTLAGGDMDRATRASTMSEMQRLEGQELELRRTIAREDARFARMHQPTVPSIGEVQSVLKPDEAVLMFVVSLELDIRRQDLGGSWCIVITDSTSRAVPLPPEDVLVPAVDRYVADLALGDGRASESAEFLYASLVEDAVAGLAPRRLIVVPDAILHRLPFAALAPAGRDPLGLRFELEQVASGAALLHQRRNPVALARSMVALADPATAEDTLPRLAGARIEAERATEWVGGDTGLYEDAEATESRLRDAATGGTSILHVGAHALVSTSTPEQSAIMLAPDGTHDGKLRPSEIAALEQAPAVVVLAGCQSAEGNVMLGDGPLGPARAFAVAGTRTVVASLWPLRDDDAVRFFDAFYSHLDRGETLARALMLTRRQLHADGLPPRAWAGIVAIGDGDVQLPARAAVAPNTDEWARRYGSLVLLALASFAVAMAVRRRR